MESYRQYRAPTENGAVLVDPSYTQQLAQLASPSTTPTVDLGGVALAELCATARRTLIADAVRYTRQYADVESRSGDGPLVVTGHQPELFHPGVWFKNFALDALAKRADGVGVHLLIDSDLCRTPSIRVPTGTLQRPRAEAVAYDAIAMTVPHEQRSVLDTVCFDSFADRTIAAVESFVSAPLVREMWPAAVEARRQVPGLSGALSAARHAVERCWGAETLELPASMVADAEPFRRFAAELLARPSDVASAYNAALADYRSAHRLKNAAQPLPDLELNDGLVEMPLWVWSDSDPIRRPLFVQLLGGELTLTNRAGWQADGPVDHEGIAHWLADLRATGLKVRSRALVTTLYARLVLSDLFLHGIGGAKYDQVTDRFAERLLGVAPPPHATMTATLRLPIDHALPSETDRQHLLQRKRDLRYHPERFAEASPRSDEAIRKKQHWIQTTKTPENAAERHEAITDANRILSSTLEDELRMAGKRLNEVERGLRDAALLGSREYSLALFPAELLRDRLTALATIE